MPDSLIDTAWLMARAACLLVLGRMRELEERVTDPSERWRYLRAALERFSQMERPP